MVSCYSSNHRISCTCFGRDALLSPPVVGKEGMWDLFHLGGYFSCTGMHTTDCLEVMAALRERGTILSLDPQFDASGQWDGRDGHLRKLLPLLDVLLPSEIEAIGISGRNSTVNEALEHLASEHPSLLVVVKCGEKGAIAGRGSRRWRCLAFEVAQIVDTTGAGDAFSAGFLHAFVKNPQDVGGALKQGCAAGALVVQSMGACSPPVSADRLADFLQRAKHPTIEEWDVSVQE